MELSQLPKIKARPKRRLGRGPGSGRGKTAGRGTKGQAAREKIKFGFEGGQLPLIKRLPLRRGKGRNVSLRPKPLVVNVKFLNLLPPNTEVDKQILVKYGIVEKDQAQSLPIKILGDGNLKIPLRVKLPCSFGAKKKIEAVGGTVELVKEESKDKR